MDMMAFLEHVHRIELDSSRIECHNGYRLRGFGRRKSDRSRGISRASRGEVGCSEASFKNLSLGFFRRPPSFQASVVAAAQEPLELLSR